MPRKLFLLPTIAGLALAFAACESNVPPPSTTPPASATQTRVSPTATAIPGNVQIAFSDKPRSGYENVPSSDIAELVDGNKQFAFVLYNTLADDSDGNLFFSPHSISLTLAMTYAGAEGSTADEMQRALHFTLDQTRLHEAINALDQQLEQRGADAPGDEKFQLEVANSVWGQEGLEFKQDFLDTLAANYGSGMRLVDYVSAETREQARLAINQWIEDNTNDRIRDVIPEGVLDEMTRLVLANAIYFKASWLRPFPVKNTHDAGFSLLDGSSVMAQMMDTKSDITASYAEGDGYKAVALPYVGNSTSMVILLPDKGTFGQFEANLDAVKLDEILSGMSYEKARIAVPKFQFESEFNLSDTLKSMGMEKAFDSVSADFSGMTDEQKLYISDVLHKSFISVDEEGTEAAASTAVIMEATSAPLKTYEFVADHPFIFLIRDNQTGEVLFLGRVLDPTS